MIRGEHSTSTPQEVTWETLESYARGQLETWLQRLLTEEVAELLGRKRYERKDPGSPAPGYRNGYGKPRRLSTSCGTIAVRRPRVRGLEERFESRILPLFQRRTQAVGELLPKLYLHGLALRDFDLALRGLLGEGAPLSPSSIARLKARWQEEYQSWREQQIEEEAVYLWADGIYVKAGLEQEKAALLTVVVGFRDGTKRVVALEGGYRESTESWAAVLRGLQARGMNVPRLVIADGHLGIWGALAELGWRCDEQRCWNHKLTNVRDALPKKVQAEAAELLKRIPYAETRAEAERRRDAFVRRYRDRYPKACERLLADWERMVAFYRYPKAHWKHLRTSNVVESPFATVRLRTGASRRYKKVENATALIWRVLMVAEQRFRKLNAPAQMEAVADGVEFVDGVRKIKSAQRHAA